MVPDGGGGGPYGPSSSVLPGDLTPQAFAGDLVELGWKGRLDWHNTAQKQDSNNPNTAHIGAKVDNPFAIAGSSASAKL